MNVALGPTGLWVDTKAVSHISHSKHRHSPSPISKGFQPPPIAGTLQFDPIALAGAIARTATLASAPDAFLAAKKQSAFVDVQHLILNGATFALAPTFSMQSDFERLAFASRCGAGVCDVVMNALGYTWRDNAASLSTSLSAHADFVYEGGCAAGHGVVLVEAHGSFAATTNPAAIARTATKKYLRQVKPSVGGNSTFGKVVHGYCTAFGSQPTASGAFLHVAETKIKKSPKASGSPPQLSTTRLVSTRVALAAHRSNFLLMDAFPISRWISWLLHGGDRPTEQSSVQFLQFERHGRSFLLCTRALWPTFIRSTHTPRSEIDDWPLHWHDWWPWRRRTELVGMFAMEQSAAEAILGGLSAMITSGSRMPDLVDLPTLEPLGMSMDGLFGERRDVDYRERKYALFRDGLMAIGAVPMPEDFGIRRWQPLEGLSAS